MLNLKTTILILLLAFNLYAENSEEIGIPYIERGKGQIDSAILAPDAKNFYTLKNDLITEWQLDPIKKVMSFKADIKRASDKYLGTHLYVTSDKSKMIIYSQDEIQLWNLKTKVLMHTKEISTVWGLMHGDEFITIDKMKNLIKWDTSTLSEQKRVVVNELLEKPHYLVSSNNILVCVNPYELVTLDVNTFEVLDQIQVHGKLYLTSDYKYFYYYMQRKVHDKWQIVSCKLNIETGEKFEVSNKWPEQFSQGLLSRAGFFIFAPMVESHVNNYLLTYAKLRVTPAAKPEYRYVFFNIKLEQPISVFYQFDNGDWLMMDTNGTFYDTKGSRKYIRMKTPSNQILPINEATFQQYHKTRK